MHTPTPPSRLWKRRWKAHQRVAGQVGGEGRQLLGGTRSSPPRPPPRSAADVVKTGRLAETKEALGGYYPIEARDIDQALDIAKAYAGHHQRGVEVPTRRSGHPGAVNQGLVTDQAGQELPERGQASRGPASARSGWIAEAHGASGGCARRDRAVARAGTLTSQRSVQDATLGAGCLVEGSGRAAQSRRVADHRPPGDRRWNSATGQDAARTSFRCCRADRADGRRARKTWIAETGCD